MAKMIYINKSLMICSFRRNYLGTLSRRLRRHGKKWEWCEDPPRSGRGLATPALPPEQSHLGNLFVTLQATCGGSLDGVWWGLAARGRQTPPHTTACEALEALRSQRRTPE